MDIQLRERDFDAGLIQSDLALFIDFEIDIPKTLWGCETTHGQIHRTIA
jgi:hypothetical protein